MSQFQIILYSQAWQ